jgi:hypothetical protein
MVHFPFDAPTFSMSPLALTFWQAQMDRHFDHEPFYQRTWKAGGENLLMSIT